MRRLEIREDLSFPTAVVEADTLQAFREASATEPREAALLISASQLLLSRTYFGDPKEPISWYATNGKHTYIGPDGTPTREPDEVVEGEFSLTYRGLRAQTREEVMDKVVPGWRVRSDSDAYAAKNAPDYTFDFSQSEVAWQTRGASLSSVRVAKCLASPWRFWANNSVVRLSLDQSDENPNLYTGKLHNFAFIREGY